MELRPIVPADVALQLRREAGFGCCRCGHPFFEYHHIVAYAVDRHYRPNDMMILCPNCHAQATSGALSETEQRELKRSPFNIRKSYADGMLKIDQSSLVVGFGTVQLVRDGFLFKVDEEDLVSVRIGGMGRLELSLRLYSRRDNLIARVENNEWKTGSMFPWDLQARWQWLKIRNKKCDVALEVDARQVPIQILGDLWRHDQHFELTESGIKFNKIPQQISISNLCWVGLYLRANSKTRSLQIVPDERFGKGVMVSEADVSVRIAKGLRIWDDLINGRPYQ